MSLATLRLSHFRSHRAAWLAFDGRPVAIFGPNGAGKTNILESVSLLSPGRGLRLAGADEIARRPEGLGWKVRAEVVTPDGLREIETWAETEARQVRIDGKAATQAALGRVLRVLWLVPAMDRLWIEAAEGRRRFLDRMTLSFHPDHAEASLAYEKAMRDRNRLLRDQVADAVWYGALEGRMAEAGATIIANRAATLMLLAAAQSGAETAFPQADLALIYPDAPPPSDVDGLTRALASGRRRDMAAGRTLTGPHRADLSAVYAAKGVPAAQCSTGEQKALLIALILGNARALADRTGAPPILLLDEVAAHLDPGRRAALYDEILRLGGQALMTGTEAGLFGELGGRAQRLEVSDAEGGSRIAEVDHDDHH